MFHEHEQHRWHPHHHFGPGRRGGPFRGGPFGGGPFGNPFGEGPFGGPGRQRQRRGDIRYMLLELIAEKPRHGYELIKLLEEQAGGFYRPSPGTIYPTLQLLEEEGNLSSETVDGKKVYSITDSGRKLLAERDAEQGDWEEGPRGPFGHQPPEHLRELRRSAMAILESVMQAGRYGTPAQITEIQALLRKTGQEIHAILARGSDEKKTL